MSGPPPKGGGRPRQRPFLVLSLIFLACSARATADRNRREADDDGDSFQEFVSSETVERGLFPNIFNLATNALVSATATCGERRQEYCKLVEHVLLRDTAHNTSPYNPFGGRQCDVCDKDDPRYRHPIEFAIDGTRRWWQSPSLAEGLEYERVNITIDLRQEYQVAYVIVKSGNAPRPGNWVLEKSLDGHSFIPWQYYATSDAECMRLFGLPGTSGIPRFQQDDEVLCTSAYSKIQPFENGEIHTSLVNGRPGAQNTSETLQRFTRARFVRLRLLTPKTLNADLMFISKGVIDRSVAMRYFFSISDISIGGQCICYGHAESCPSDNVTGQFRCECRHNTCGESCSECCPLFNQLPWRPGTNAEQNSCEPCQCFNHATRCVYDPDVAAQQQSVTPEGVFEGGGRCVDCAHNTEGVNCERCKPGYYRPSGITHYRPDACRACECDAHGAVDDTCIRDDTQAQSGEVAGQCSCRPGFGGRRCERCAVGYRNYPKCEPCPCNQAGSTNFATCEEDRCVCKPNVEGRRCEKCRPGFINLDADNPDGCQACFCFGLSANCSEGQWKKNKIRTNVGWRLSDLSGVRSVEPEGADPSSVQQPQADALFFNANQNRDKSLYYWKAPQDFLGNLLSSYGGTLQYWVYFVPTEHAPSVHIADVIIEGSGYRLEYHSRIDFFPRENMTVVVRLREGAGWYNAQTRQPAKKVELMSALANVDRLLVRGQYNQNQVQSSIFGLALDSAAPLDTGDSIDYEISQTGESAYSPLVPLARRPMGGVEVCQCPEFVTGYSCESCVAGFRRVSNQLVGGRCERCECNGHSDKCDPFTGACLDCQHNTTGHQCERCAAAHYGNPAAPGGVCRPCACPTVERSHSSECHLAQLVLGAQAAASSPDDFVCTACEPGYDGNKCELCADGYFGDALNGGTCERCNCSGNVDAAAIGNCDRSTGRCLKCIKNTDGEHCERCLPNHFGSAASPSGCQPCDCHHKGAVSAQCSGEEGGGRCECREFYAGARCEHCAPGHGDVDAGCPACACNATGAHGEHCDDVSGQCQCKAGVFGRDCSQCASGYFNFTVTGCQFCSCDAYGSQEESACDPVTGACRCLPNVEGTSCERCASGYFNITSRTGCQACGCNEIGAEVLDVCDLVSGQCQCKSGVIGDKCDRCAPNHYGFGPDGCKQCRRCPAPGQVCDPVTGDCVCPPNTQGEMCEHCTTDSWNHDPLTGCTSCNCSSVGAQGTTCNAVTGQCECRSEFVGRQCDRCHAGYFGFPTCEPCACDARGTESAQCLNDGSGSVRCLCDDEGNCPCKRNVEGEKCDRCRNGSFSLDATNPLGCTSCFCFGRSSQCEQAELDWQQLYATDRRAEFSSPWVYYAKKHALNVLPDAPPQLNSYPTDHTPLYWSAPRSLLGDRSASYGAYIRFRLHNEDNRLHVVPVRPDEHNFRYFPQVVLVGAHRLELEHIPSAGISEDGRYKVRLHESAWRSRSTPDKPVTRKQIMIALQNLQALYVRATYNYPARGDAAAIKEWSLDVAAPTTTAAARSDSNSTALGVEQCLNCPPGYAGRSCQDPAPGYCRKRSRDYLNTPDELALLGWSEPCACNGHSTVCDPETCLCKECAHHTTGDFCHLCESFYYGDARAGGEDACKRCECPSADNNFAAGCVASPHHPRGYVCQGCRPGYTGLYCESCVAGYFGDPTATDGFCSACDCHPDGSLHGACDPVNGQCVCRPGVGARDCSLCQPRHAFIGGVCTSCDTGCTAPLMAMADELEATLTAQDFSHLKPVPWKRLARIENTTNAITELLGHVERGREGVEGLVDGVRSNQSYLSQAEVVVDEAQFVLDRIDTAALALKVVLNETVDHTGFAQKTYARAFDLTNQLMHYQKHGAAGDHLTGVDTDVWAVEAEAHANATAERGAYIEKRLLRVQDELRRSEELLKKVMALTVNDTSFDISAKRLDELKKWTSAFRTTVWDQARTAVQSATKLNAVLTKRIERFKNVADEIEQLRGSAQDNFTAYEDQVALAEGALLANVTRDSEATKELLADSELRIDEARGEADQYAQLLDQYETSYAANASRRASQLQAEAARLAAAFAQTRSEAASPVKASASYEAIRSALRNATKAADQAQEAAEAARQETDASSDSSPLAEAAESLQNSKSIAKDATDLIGEWESGDLEKLQTKMASRLSAANDALLEARKRVDAFKHAYTTFDDQHERQSGLLDTAQEAEERADKATAQTEAAEERVAVARKRAQQLEQVAGQGIRNVTEQVTQAHAGVETAVERLTRSRSEAGDQRERLNELHTTLNRLKHKLDEARSKASAIRLAVKGDEKGRCKRSYVSPARPGPTTRVSMRFRPLRAVPNTLLLWTRTKARRTQQAEYVAVEIRDQRVVAHWDVGAGRQRATNPHPIRFVPPGDRTAWYDIIVDRRANTLNLTVALREFGVGEGARDRDPPVSVFVDGSSVAAAVEADADGGEAPQEQGSSPSVEKDTESVSLNSVVGETTLSLGGADKTTAKEIGLGSHRFKGVLGDLEVDGEQIPLWTFASTTPDCEGEAAPPRRCARSTPFVFRDGFAVVHAYVGDRANEQSLSVTFSTHSPTGLLYFRGGRHSGDFLALELRDNGRVVFSVNAGDKSRASVSSTNRYADGKQHTARALRTKDGIQLQVDGEADRVAAALPADGPQTLNIESDEHYVAGVPSDFPRRSYAGSQIQWRGFSGAILSVRPAPMLELDLEHATRWQRRASTGCAAAGTAAANFAGRIVGFRKAGQYVLLPGLGIASNGSLSFSFRTRQENATILFASSRLDGLESIVADLPQQVEVEGFFSVYLASGRLVLRAADGTGAVGELRADLTPPLADGQLHAVHVQRADGKLTLRVDDHRATAKSAALGAKSPIGGRALVLGALPDGLKLDDEDELPERTPLVGCVSDIFLDMQPVALTPLRHDGAQIGYCAAEQRAVELDESNVGTVLSATDDESTTAVRPVSRKKSRLVTSVRRVVPRALADALRDIPLNRPPSESLELRDFADELTAATTGDKRGGNKINSIFGDQDDDDDEEGADDVELEDMLDGGAVCGGGGESSPLADDPSAAHFGLSRTSYARIDLNDDHFKLSTKSFAVSMRIRSFRPDGLLWLWGSYRELDRYMTLYVRAGRLLLEIRDDEGAVRRVLASRRGGSRLDDGRWHSVRLLKRDRRLLIQVDDRPTASLTDAPATPRINRRRFYVGGLSSKHRSFADLHGLPQAWQGCIRQLTIDGRRWSRALTDPSASRDLQPCGFARANSVHLLDAGFIELEPMRLLVEGQTINSAGKKGGQQQGAPFALAWHWASAHNPNQTKQSRVLAAVLDPAHPAHAGLAVTLRDDRLTIRIWHAPSQLNVTAVTQLPATPSSGKRRASCEDGGIGRSSVEWRSTAVQMDARRLVFNVDGLNYERAFVSTVKARAVLSALPIYLGGLPKSVDEPALPFDTTGGSVAGCYRDVETVSRALLLPQVSGVRRLHRAVFDICPIY